MSPSIRYDHQHEAQQIIDPETREPINPESAVQQGGPLTADLAAGGHAITGLADGVSETDAMTVGQASLSTVVVDLTAAEIATLSSVPVTILPAPGTNKVAVPVSGSFVFIGGDQFYEENREVVVRWGAYDTVLDFDTVSFTGTGSVVPRPVVNQPLGGDLAYYANQPLIVVADVNPGSAGNGTARVKIVYYTVEVD